MELTNFPGYVGRHTRDEVTGAYPNGTRVVKIRDEPGDAHRIGSLATVLGSISAPIPAFGEFFYFVEWDDVPRVAVGVVGSKIGRTTDGL